MRRLWRDRYRVYGSLTGQYGLDYCIAEADTTSDMTASTTMAALPWTSLAPPYVSATTWATGVCEHNPMRDEGSEQCIRSASLSPFEPTICFDDPFSDFLSLFSHFEPEQREDTCASTHTTSQAMEHALQSAPEASPTYCGQSEFSALRSPAIQVHSWPNTMALQLMRHGTLAATTQPHRKPATYMPPPPLLDHPMLPILLGQCDGHGPLCFQNVSPWNATQKVLEPLCNGTEAVPLCNGTCPSGKEFAIYFQNGTPWNTTLGTTPWQKVLPRDHSDTSSAGEALHHGTCSSGKELATYQVLETLSSGTEVVPFNNGTCGIIWPLHGTTDAAKALCLDHFRRRGKRDWVKYELHWNYMFSNKNCARVQSTWMGMIWPFFLCFALVGFLFLAYSLLTSALTIGDLFAYQTVSSLLIIQAWHKLRHYGANTKLLVINLGIQIKWVFDWYFCLAPAALAICGIILLIAWGIAIYDFVRSLLYFARYACLVIFEVITSTTVKTVCFICTI